MDPKKLKRDAGFVNKTLKELQGVLYATKPTFIYCPVRFSERDLAYIEAEINIVGIFAIVVEDKYAVSTINAMMRIVPTSYKIVSIDETDYFEFYFEPGATVVANMNLVKTDVLVYSIYDEIISKGNIPWYLSYFELAGLFDTAQYHAGANIGTNREITELIVSLIARDEADRSRYYRRVVKSIEEVNKKPPVFIPMRSVIYAATNTLNKIAGSYMEPGIVSALVSPSDRVENIEQILRN